MNSESQMQSERANDNGGSHCVQRVVRALREWWKPALKCQRLGHDYKQVPLRRYEWPSKCWRAVADEVWMEQEVCRRCGAKGTEKETDRDSIQSLSMPSDWWKQLKRDGKFQVP